MAEPSDPSKPASRVGADLKIRLVSALVLMAVTVGAVWAGGIVFAALAALAAGLILYEWAAMVGPFSIRVADKAAIVFTAFSVFAAIRDPVASLGGLAAVAAALVIAGQMDPALRRLGFGVLYAGLPGLAAVVLRNDGGEDSFGLAAIAYVCAVVWATDSAAYFAGRLTGGPKLWPRVSPKKTWSGALGGLAAAIAAGVAVGALAGLSSLAILGLIAAALSIVSQAGDLFESAMKRRSGVKDSGWIIPGHGGIMDRVDGLVVALALAGAIGVARDGVARAAEGLLVW